MGNPDCSKCHSFHVVRAGTRRGKPAFVCRGCGYQFVKGALTTGRPQLTLTPKCIYYQGMTRKRGSDARGRQRYECKECQRFFIY